MFNLKKSLGSIVLGVALAGGVLVSSFAPQVAVAQADLGSISGVVTDSAGATIARATVTVTNTQTGAVRVVETSGSGDYSVSQLNPGDYSVAVSATGFATATQTLHVSVGSKSTINPKLGVAGSQTEVIVTADDTTSVHLENSEVSTVIQTQDVANLPLLDRDPYQLIKLAGNVSSDPTAASRGGGFNISGARSASTDILLDGAENTDLFGAGIGQRIPLEAMQEFRVVTANMGPEYGRASGGAVNVSTKAGTNSLHGTVYEYNRISTFASNGFNNNALFAAGAIENPKSRYVHNQFGYYLGGPIFRDKLFFSSATQWTRIRSNATVSANVALPGLIALSDPRTQAFFNTYGSKLEHPVNGNTYTGAQIAATGLWKTDIATLAESHPEILNTPLFGIANYQNPGDSGGGTPQNTWNTFNRVDWTISQKTTAYFRYLQSSEVDFDGTVNTSPYAGYNTGQTQKNYNGLISLTHSFSPSLASNTKLQATRFNNLQPLSTAPVGPTLYVNGSSSATLGAGTIYFPGYSATTPGNAIPFGGPQNFIQAGEDLTWSKGKHNFKVGGQFLYIKDNRVFGAYQNAVDGLVQSGTKNGLINFVNGNLGLLQVALDPQGAYPCTRDVTTGDYIQTPACTIQLPAVSPNFSRSNRYKDGAVYVADSYKVSPRLTVNAGLRWEVYGPQHSQKESYDANLFFGTSGNLYQDIRDAQIKTRVDSPDNRLWKLNLLQFGPRFGFAYDLTGDGKTSIRGGFSLSYERNFNNVTFNVIQNPPNYGVVSFTAADNNNQLIPLSTNNFAQFGEGTGGKLLPNVTLRAVDPKIKPAYAENWSLTLEHSFAQTNLITLGYVGSRGIHNYSIANINRSFAGANYLGDDANSTVGPLSNRLNLQYSNINFRGADGDSYYEAANLGFRSSNLLHTHLNVNANYTYAHSIDNTSSTFTDGGSNNANGVAYLDPFNHGLDRGNSDFDQRHRVSAALSWAIPFFSHSGGLTQTLLGGWNSATTFSAVTGNPYSIYDCYYAVTVCPRVSFAAGKPRFRGQTGLVDKSSLYGPNTYSYQHLNAYTTDDNGFPVNYNTQLNPLVNEYYGGDATTAAAGSDTPICGSGGQCQWVKGMTGRNAFSGPGSWTEDFNLSKAFKVRERYSLELRADFINVFNHANTRLNLGGTNDVSSYQDILAYKDGNRNTELQARFVF